MVFPLAAFGAGLEAIEGVSYALDGFFGNSENDAIHAENKKRVAEIDAANQQRHFENLSISSRFKNKSNQLKENLFNIDTAAGQARADAQSTIDAQLDKYMVDNQTRYIKLMQSKTGPRSGRTNVRDRFLNASEGRNKAAGKAMQDAAYDKLLSADYVRNRSIQNAKAGEKAKVSTAPIFQAYQTDYTPQAYKTKGFGDYLQLAGGLAGAAKSGMDMFDKLKIKNHGKPGGMFKKGGSLEKFGAGMNLNLNGNQYAGLASGGNYFNQDLSIPDFSTGMNIDIGL